MQVLLLTQFKSYGALTTYYATNPIHPVDCSEKVVHISPQYYVNHGIDITDVNLTIVVDIA